MTIHLFRSMIKRLAVLFVSLVMLLSVTQTAVLAAPSRADEPILGVPGITEPVPGEDIGELKEGRREWQSKASSSHDVKDDKSASLGEKLKNKLNVDEITDRVSGDDHSESTYQRSR